jgi:hypothetical protein
MHYWLWLTSPKRPRDLNQWQKLLVDLARGVACNKQPRPDEQEKKKSVAAAHGQAGGLKSGKARDEKLSAEERLALASKLAGIARCVRTTGRLQRECPIQRREDSNRQLCCIFNVAGRKDDGFEW